MIPALYEEMDGQKLTGEFNRGKLSAVSCQLSAVSFCFFRRGFAIADL
jgi:hypothetical protein